MEQDPVRAELKAKRVEGAVLKRLGGMKQRAAALVGGGVPGPVRAIVEDLFAAPVASRVQRIGRRRGTFAPHFKELSPAERSRIIETLLPRLAPAVEGAWGTLARRPYQEGLSRRPFRCPRAVNSLADLRARWLLRVTLLLGEYDADVRWVAERAAHLAGWFGAADLGWLLAGAIDAGGETGAEVQRILIASATGEHDTGRMGRHVTQALLSCGRPEAWEFVEKLLLSAQRQEGLRQAILESVDESHPEAFRRMLRLIREERLSRFSSVVRAADTWFGFQWDGTSAVKIDGLLERVLLFLDDPAARTAALDEPDAETVYLALWSAAFEDVDAAIALAAPRLASPSADVRFVVTHFLVQTIWSSALPHLVEMLGDPDLRVAARALDMFAAKQTAKVDGERLFAALEGLMARVPARAPTLDAPVWPWWTRTLERSYIAAAMMANAPAAGGERLLRYVPELDPSGRESFVRRSARLARERAAESGAPPTLSAAERRVAIDLLGDPSAAVRRAAFEAMDGLPLESDEVDRLVDLLGRKADDLRGGALARLRALRDPELLDAADRLLADASDLRRLAGLELLRDAAEKGRAIADVRARAERYAAAHSDPGDQERAHLTVVLGDRTATPTTDDALGLIDRASLPAWPSPAARRVVLDTDAARRSVQALAELVLAHQTTEIGTTSGEVVLLAELGMAFGPRTREDLEKADAAVPLAAVWKGWLRERPDGARDDDGLELLRALLAEDGAAPWKTDAAQQVRGLGKFGAGARFLRGLCEWCVAWEPPAGGVDFLLDGLENAIAAFTAADHREIAAKREARVNLLHGSLGEKDPPFRAKLKLADRWLKRARWWRTLFPASVTPAQATRLYALLRAFEARAGGCDALAITAEDFTGAYRAGAAGESELVDLLVGRASRNARPTLLRHVSARKPARELLGHPELLAVVDRCRRRIVEVETRRGDRATAVSDLAIELRWTGGLDTIARAIPALGKTHFARSIGWSASGASRQETLSHLVLRSVPREEDTPEAFARWAREARIAEERLVELALYAPQWAAHVNHVLQWPGLEDAVWWIQAHTKDDRSWRLAELKELWAAAVSERTPLSAAELTEGAVDVAWFARTYAQLGTERWKTLDRAAKYAASSAGHTRAQLFARAMAGLVTREEILARIEESRHQDSVRALGLLPLAGGDADGRDVLERYARLEEFRRQARKHGALRRQSEERAVTIGLANLARTAGFRDPQRLRWAMEQRAVADLAAGPIVLTRDDVTLTLSIDADGAPALAVTKNGKALKAIPAPLKKDAEVEELRHRRTELGRQRARVRDTLEEAMCRGDRFQASELRTLLEHPILAPALAKLVFVGDGGVAGYAAEGGRVLRDHEGATHVLGHGEDVRVAHPHDLLARGDWAAWQRECFRAERIQPFKQLFRELYPITDTERGTERSRRYAGHQVNPRQALALLGGRGWVARPEEGVSRTFHEDGVTARLGFEEAFYTPADVEGLTLDEVVFTRKGEWKPLPLDTIPARLFSETMRDLDLVVSVAHRGGVDPEATASTVEMRAALVQETCELLGIGNVTVAKHHALVHGTLGEYSVHLGSAGVMLLPGTALPIVAVHSQHRGRLFLPFADDDPRTAEVLSKVLLLARDRELRDPRILDWIRAAKGGGIA